MRCGSRATYERTVLRLTKEQQALQSGGGVVGDDDAGNRFVGANIDELTILSAPYRPPMAPRAVGTGQSLLLTGPSVVGTRNLPSSSGAAGGGGVVVQQQGVRAVPAGMGSGTGLPPPPLKRR